MTTYQGELLEHTQAHAQAAYWFTRLNSGEATAAELREFEDWRRDNPENERSYRYICYFCDASLDAPEHEIRRLLASSGEKAALLKPYHRGLLAGLFVLALALTVFFFWPERVLRQEHLISGAQTLEQRFVDGAVVQLGPDSALEIREYEDRLNLQLLRGQVTLLLADPTPKSVTVFSSFAQARSNKGQFSAFLNSDQMTFAVDTGSIEVSSGTWWRRQSRVLIPGQYLDVDRWSGMKRVQPAPVSPNEAD
jgi:transmembrane sensor